MNCPKCEGTLHINEGEGHIGFVCNSCEGIWLSKKYITSLKHNYNIKPEELALELAEESIEALHICPSCNINLNKSTVNNIELEWCKSCSGVWFDKNELNSLTTLYKKETTAGQRISEGVDGVALVLSFLSSLSA